MGTQSRLIGIWLALAALLGAAGSAAADPAAWRIAGRNGGEITLLGSMHVLRSADYPLPAAIDALFARADTLVMELDLDELDPTAMQATLLRVATLPQGTVLRDVVPPDLYRLTEQRAGEVGMDLRLLEHFKPSLVSVMLLEQSLRRLGFEGERGLEQYLLRKSRAEAKPIIGLETLDMQLGIFADLPATSQQAMLEQTLRDMSEGDTVIGKLADAWRDGKLETLSKELLASLDDIPGLDAALVRNRNTEWVKTLERFLGDGRRYLVVVGAFHLVGHDNVIDMLDAHGQKAVRVH
jgi:uncharacterized protein YbaP (TraB family)